MTDGLDQALVSAGLDRLRADPQLTVHDGVVPDGATPPYVLVYAAVVWPDEHPDHSLTNASTKAVVTWTCHCVGSTAAAARAVAQRVRTQLVDFAPTVAGVQCNPVGQVESNPPVRDESTGQAVLDLVQVYEMYACK